MHRHQNRLTSLAQASSILDRQAHKLGVSVGCLRVLALLSEIDTALYKATVADLAKLLYWHYNTALLAVNECVTNKWLLPAGARNVTYTITLEGLRIAGILQRAESEARNAVLGMKLPVKPRKYVRKQVDK